MTRPTALTVCVDSIPEALRRERRWVMWRYVLRDGRWTKVPFHASGAMAKTNDPTTWTTFAAALAAYRTGRFDGYVLALDNSNAYWELSPSGTGYKVIGRAARIGGEVNFKTGAATFATWTGARFFAITGHYQSASSDATVDISDLIARWFPVANASESAPLDLPSMREGYAGAADMSDDMLWGQMIGGYEAYCDAILALYHGDTSAYGGDHSRADLALCCHLAWWTNYDAERVDRMFRQSGLYREAKWKHDSYRRATIGKALR
jgi:putative DNA primase/helicase